MADDTTDNEKKAPLSLGKKTLELKKTVEKGRVRQSFSHGRSKEVKVEVRRKRSISTNGRNGGRDADDGLLTNQEKAQRLRVLQEARKAEEEAKRQAVEDAKRQAEEAAKRQAEEEAQRQAEEDAKRKAEEEAQRQAEEDAKRKAAEEAEKAAEAVARAAKISGGADGDVKTQDVRKPQKPVKKLAIQDDVADASDDDGKGRRKVAKGGAAAVAAPKVPAPKKGGGQRRRSGKLTITAALSDEDREERGRSLSSVRRARE